MKTHHLVYNLVALAFAAFVLIGMLALLLVVYRGGQDPVILFVAGVEALVAVLLTVGAIANLVLKRLAPLPTCAIIVGYLLTVWLIPFAIWGVVALIKSNKNTAAPHA